jgi:hypothetical protein
MLQATLESKMSEIPDQAAPFSVCTVTRRALVVIVLAITPGALAAYLLYRSFDLRNRQQLRSQLFSKFPTAN